MEEDSDISYEKQLNKITIFDVIILIHRSRNDVSTETIINCFDKGIENCYNPLKMTNNPILNDDIQLPFENEVTAYQLLDVEATKLPDLILQNYYENKEVLINAGEDFQSDQECSDPKTLTLFEAFDKLDELERYFINNDPENVSLIWNVETL
ncbi:hypothetical protein DMUE_2915 [Dictyocoela muelleri]|nr:hypothetical protein DMUE_2915 [Dictyocoela muelleri]